MRDKQQRKNPTNADLTRKETTELKRYKKYITPYLSAFVIGPLMMLTEVAGEVMLPKFMSMIINNGVASRNVAYIGKMGTLMVLTVLFMAVGGILGAYFSAKASISFTSDMRNDLFRKVQQFSFENIDDYSTGSLVTRLTNDVQQVQNVLMMGLRMALRAPGMFLGALIMAFMMNRQLAVIILIVIPLLLAAIILILKTAFPRFGEMQRRLDRLNSGIQESLTNVRVVKSFVREDHEIEKFSKLNDDLKESSLRALRIVIATMPVMMFAMNVTTLAVVWYGGNIIIAGKMPVGDLTAFTTYIVQILMSLMMLSMVFLQSSRASASMKRINEIFDTEIGLNDDHAKNKDKKVTEGRVEFKNVSFGYSGENGRKDLVLEGISFTAEPGQTIGIIGSTGSGKTSLLQLIPRLYDVTGGEVLVDGVNVKEYSLKHLREGVGMVLQKNILFSGTIEENLRWGNEDAPMEDVIRFSESAQADPFVKTFKKIYNEPENAFVADFIGDSNIIDGTMIQDKVVEILGVKIPCVDEGFGNNTPVDVVIRPEDIEIVEPEKGFMEGDITSVIFKGVHYEIEIVANGFEWLVHTTLLHNVGEHVGINVIPFNIQIMNKPESEDEESVEIDA